MPDIQELATMSLALKFQTDLDVPAEGAGAFGIEVLPSTGLASQIAAIESAMIRRSRMRKRPRHGMETVTTSYETELSVGPLTPVFEGVLGGTTVPAQPYSNTDWGTLTITGGGGVGTFSTGTALVDGLVAGNFIRFAGLGLPGNNGKWIPIIDVQDGVLKFPVGPKYLLDEPVSAAWTAEVAAFIATSTPYTDRYVSVEEAMNDAAVQQSKYGTDMRFHTLNVSVDPKAYVKIGFGLTGRELLMKVPPEFPVFEDPVFIESDSLILLDGGIYINGVRRTDLTSLKFGLTGAVTTIGVIGSNIAPDVSLGQFAFTGDFTGLVSNDAEFQSVKNEDDISICLHCKEKSTDAFVGFYIGYCSYAGYSTPMGGEGLLVQTIPLFGGEDERGPGHAKTTILVSYAPA
jgi:hypothetical protein